MSNEPTIALSALRHGVTIEDILYAWRNPMDYWPAEDGFTMLIGPSRSGHILEIGVFETASQLRVIHAMSARQKYLR